MRVLTAFALLFLAAATAQAQEWSVQSPDSRTRVAVTRSSAGALTWRVSRGGSAVLEESPLGIRRADEAFTAGMRFVRASATRTIDERYNIPHGKRRDRRVRGRERTLTFETASGKPLEVIVRAHDDGVAFRYRFPGSGSEQTVVEEQSGFRVPSGSTAWLQPMEAVERTAPAYEELYSQVVSGTPAPRKDGWAFPALFKTTAGVWLLVTESAVDNEYCASHLAAESPNGVYRIAFPDPAETKGIGDVAPKSTLPWTMPWRVVMIGDRSGAILESTLVEDLSPPSRVRDTSWIKPGRAAWSWWSASASPRHAPQLNAFTDLAAEMGWEYSLVDANWNIMQTGNIDDVLAHAKEKNVGLLIWYNSGGPHNDVTEQPRDLMHVRDVRRAEFAKLKAWGIKGVKVDFWHSDKQYMIRQYRDTLADAADFQLMIDYHGSTIPRGWAREFPHLMSMEGVYGAEQYKFTPEYAAGAAVLNTILPYTRNTIGAMDYTPVTFTDVRHPRRTTNGHELALSVVFESALQHFADSVQAYRTLPEPAKSFLKAVPAAWDETLGLSGEPGDYVVMARRLGNSWYVGGLNARDTERMTNVPLRFLGSGSWTATIIKDGNADREFASETQQVTAASQVTLAMRGRGGFVIRLEKR